MALCGNHFFYFYDLSGGQRGFFFFFFLTLHSLCMERLGSLYSQRNSACGFVVWELFRRKTGQLEFEKQSSNCSLDHMQPWGLAKVLSAFED